MSCRKRPIRNVQQRCGVRILTRDAACACNVKTYHKFRKKTSPAGFPTAERFFWYPIECALCHLYPTLMRRPRPLSDLKISGRIKYNYHRNKGAAFMPKKIIRRKHRLSSFQTITLGFAGVHFARSTAADASDLHNSRMCNAIQ